MNIKDTPKPPYPHYKKIPQDKITYTCKDCGE